MLTALSYSFNGASEFEERARSQSGYLTYREADCAGLCRCDPGPSLGSRLLSNGLLSGVCHLSGSLPREVIMSSKYLLGVSFLILFLFPAAVA